MTVILNPIQVRALEALTSQSHDTEDTMNPAIDAEGPAEIGAYLRACGWYQAGGADAFMWHHPALPALPPITMQAAFELAQAADTVGPERRNPAEPPRRH